MDKISVTDAALQNAYIILRQLSDNSEAITEKCVSGLTDRLNSIDEKLRADIMAYIEKITKLKEKLKYCIDENTAALSDRFAKIPDYENQTYKKRNII